MKPRSCHLISRTHTTQVLAAICIATVALCSGCGEPICKRKLTCVDDSGVGGSGGGQGGAGGSGVGGSGGDTGQGGGVAAAYQIRLGSRHGCALMKDEVWCWGRNTEGQLGNGTTNDSHSPVLVTGLPAPPVAIDVGYTHTCAVLVDGRVFCWGQNQFGQLGDGNIPNNAESPVEVVAISGARSVAAGSGGSCALLDDFSVWCWGSNVSGGLGNGSTDPSDAPVQVLLGDDVKAVRAYTAHMCAQLVDDSLWCWGSNANGQLGTEPMYSQPTPAPVAGMVGTKAFDVGGGHTCAAIAGDVVKCWGSDSHGQLGDGPPVNSEPGIVEAVGIDGAIQLALGHSFSCALRHDGVIRCWGRNTDGELGNGTMSSGDVPVAVSGLEDVVDIAASNGFACAMQAGGTAWCWGVNDSGQLGSNNTMSSTLPVQVAF